MKHITLVGVVLAFGLTLRAADMPPPALDGTYKAVTLTREGKDEPAAVVDTVTLKIAGDEFTFSAKGKTFPAKIKVDPKAKPAAIDISPSDGPEKGHTFPGIYKVENGELWLAFTERGDRPTEFKGTGGTLLVRLKREAKAKSK
jgi:uncharacterized protein (TIGR03067 family)